MRSIQKRFKYALLAPVFIVATLVMQFSNVSLVAAATVTWDGGGSDDNFSTAENWTGDAVPQANDDLVFPANAGTDTTLVNDLGVSFNDVTVNGGAGSAGSYDIDTLDLIDGAVITVIGSDTQVNITDVDAAGDLTINGGSQLDITTLDVTTDLTVSGVFDATTVNVGGNLSSSVAFTATTVDVTGNAVLDTAAPVITTLSADDLTVDDDDLSVTTLNLSGDYLAASTGTLTVTGTFTVPANYTVAEAFTAGTFVVGGDLDVNVLPTVTTLTVTGDLTSDVALSVTTLNLTGDYLAASTGTLAVTGTFTVPSDYTVSESFTAGTFDVGGNLTVTTTFTATTTDVTGNLTVQSAFTPGNLTVGGNLTATTDFTVNGTLTTSGTLTTGTSGSGYMTVTGAYTSTTDLTINNRFSASSINVTGDLTVNAYMSTSLPYTVSGDMILNDTVYMADGSDVTGQVTVETYSYLIQEDASTVDFGSLLVKNGANATLSGTIDFPVTFGSGSSKSAPSLTANNYSSVWDAEEGKYVYTYETLTFDGDITLDNDLRVTINGDKETGKVEFNGDITYNGFAIKKSNASTGKLFIGGKEVKNPVVTTEFNGEKYSDSESVAENETATLNGERGSITVYPGGVLKGTGTAIYGSFAHDATLSPGNSPGTITFLNTLFLAEDSIYNVELKSTSAYDQTVVGEEYSGGGNAVLIDGADLNLVLYAGYSIKVGDEFTIIDNQSDTDIEGTFAGLAEGDTINLGGGSFEISYIGGDGNDVVLTVITAPTATVGAPNTGLLRLIQANPAVSALIGLMTAAILFMLARRQLAMQRR